MSVVKNSTRSAHARRANSRSTSCSPSWISVKRFVETATLSEPMTACVDLDSVLLYHEPADGISHLGRVLPLGRKLVKLLKSRGYCVVVLTSRPNQLNQPNFWLCHGGIRTHLLMNDIPVDEVTNVKPPANFYFDDKAVRVEKNWK
jgi:hypothetical protein